MTSKESVPPAVSRLAKPVTIRDTVHGDVMLGPVERAVVDTRIFQRLRYIRQNGLLHFVFPGAVHTRFAHSIGTMHVASRVAHTLFANLRNAESQRDIDYLALVFRLAALLHDVGHCAFSHSIEHIHYEGKPLLGTTKVLFERWMESTLLNEYVCAHADDSEPPDIESDAVSHEQIGLILARRIFESEAVRRACESMDESPTDVSRDTRALMDGCLPTTARFAIAAKALAKRLTPESVEDPTSDVTTVLHTLVSGTLDVDRLDYLVRDSIHCGVSYGKCQVDLLVNSLELGIRHGRITLLLRRKAAHALDDMLWSRYQLFLQVYNHKTNVGLNTALERALRDGFDDDRIKRPSTFDDFIAFIDDYVIGTLFHAATHIKSSGKRRHIETLVDRQLLVHLDEVRVAAGEDFTVKLTAEQARLAAMHGLGTDEILVGTAKSTLIKDDALLPTLVELNRHTGALEHTKYSDISTLANGGNIMEHEYRIVHFFADRETPT